MRWIVLGLFGVGLVILGTLVIEGHHRWLWIGAICYILAILLYCPKGQLSLWEGLSLTPEQQDNLYIERQNWLAIQRKMKVIEDKVGEFVSDYEVELNRFDRHTFEQLYMNQWRVLSDESDELGGGNHG